MLSGKFVNRNEVLSFARRMVADYCRTNKVPLIPVQYGIVPFNAKATFYYPPPKITLWTGISNWLEEEYNIPYIRVWALHSCIGHELFHYYQYLDKIKRGAKIKLKDLEDEAQLAGRQYADDVVSKYTEGEINPILPEIASGAVTGAGIAIGFKGVDLLAKRAGIKNPRRITPERKHLLDTIPEYIKIIETATGKPIPSWRPEKDPIWLEKQTTKKLETLYESLRTEVFFARASRRKK